MGYSTIKAQIVSILQSQITKANYVYSYEERKPAGYPAITVTNYDGNGEFADTSRNRREYIFRILCMQEITETTMATAESSLADMIDQIITTFDSSTYYNLNNTCQFAIPAPSKWGYVQVPEIEVRSAEVILTAVVVN